MPAYTVAQISAEHIELTYTLVQTVEHSLDQEGWRGICEAVIRRRGQLMGADHVFIATNSTGYVRGVCMFRKRNHTRYGQLLDVPIFVAISAGDAAGVSEAMLDHLKTTAHNQKCQMMRVWRLGTDNWSRTLLKDEFERSDHGLLIPIPSPGES